MSTKTDRGDPASDPLHRAIATLQRLSDLFVERREQLAAEAGLSVRQWGVLEEIASEHFMPSLFARRRSVSPAAVSKVLRGLVDAGLVQAGIAEDDARQRRYRLTTRGRRRLDGLRTSRQRAIEEVWADLPRTELTRFSRFGETLAERLEAYADDSGAGGR